MRTKCFLLLFAVVAVATAVVVGCSNPLTAGSSSGGSLSIQIGNNINARTLLPPIDMNAASYSVSGSGPGGSSFSRAPSSGTLTVDHLVFGSWTVTVDALNSAGTIIGSGQATATVNTGQTTTLAISVVPLSGNGGLNLQVSWTASQVEYPSIQASLIPPSGSPMVLGFGISGNTASYSSSAIPAGYWTLSLQLLDNGIPVMGAVDVARIVAGQTTSGSYSFTNVNQPGGTIQVNITPALGDPIPVSISGVPAEVTAGTSVTATASASDGTTNATYVWYLNGVSVATGSTYTIPSTTAAGYYRLDVTAFTPGGRRAGSASTSFHVGGGSKIYAATLGGGLSISEDGGASWRTYTTADGLGDDQVFDAYATGSTIYAATVGGLSVSTDNGATWRTYSTADGLGGDIVISVFVTASAVYAATYGGLSISTDGGASWRTYTTADGLGSNNCSGVYVTGSTIYLGTDGGGLSVSRDGGASWRTYTTADGLGSDNVLSVYAAGSTIYATTYGGLSVSRDGGVSWRTYTTADGLAGDILYQVYVSGSTIYTAGGGGLSVSRDGGASWRTYTAANGLASNYAYGVYVSGSTIYVATQAGLSVSRDSGTSWNTYTTADGLGNDYVRGVYVQ